jgi:hypothetical protein
VSKYVVTIFFWAEIADKLEQSELVVNDQEHRIVFVDTLELEGMT